MADKVGRDFSLSGLKKMDQEKRKKRAAKKAMERKRKAVESKNMKEGARGSLKGMRVELANAKDAKDSRRIKLINKRIKRFQKAFNSAL